MFIQTRIIKDTHNPGEVEYKEIAIDSQDVFSVENQMGYEDSSDNQLLVTFKNKTTMLIRHSYYEFINRLNFSYLK